MASLELEGMDSLLNEIEKLGSAGEKIEKIALVQAGEKVKEAIIAEAPNRTGALKRGIKVSKLKRLDGVGFVEVYPSKNVFYSAFLEFGTTKMRADPFMSRGYESSKDDAERAIEEEIKKGLSL